MDIVPPPEGTSVPPIDVPFVATAIYEPTTKFSEFPELCGYAKDGGLNLDQPQEQVASFIQSWLYFGLLSAILKSSIEQSKFEERVPHSQWPSIVMSRRSARLFRMICTTLWSTLMEKMLHPQSPAELLVVAAHAINVVEQYFHNNCTELLATVCLAVKILLSALATILGRTRKFDATFSSVLNRYHFATHPFLEGAEIATMPPSSLILKKHMLENGWCRSQALDILVSFDYTTAYFFARLPRTASLSLDHSRCDLVKCFGWNSKPEGQTRHRSPDCTCGTVKVSTNEVASIIRKGGIPLVLFRKSADGNVYVELRERKK
jgi:hypothetical protein